jgi:hypothetical protein
MNAIGIGDVFRAYHDGRIEDNDEVALQHGPAELGYVPLTEAMANVRATLATAIRAGVLTPTDETALNLGRSPFVTKIALDQAPVAGVCSETLDRFATWRSTNSIDVTRRTTPDQRRAKSLPVIVTCETKPTLSRTKYWVSHDARFRALLTRSQSSRSARGQPHTAPAVPDTSS